MQGRREAIFNGRGEISGVHHVLCTSVEWKMRIAGLETATVNQQHERPRPTAAWLQRFPVQRCAVIGNAVSFCLLNILRYAVKGEARDLSVDTESGNQAAFRRGGGGTIAGADQNLVIVQNRD